jgi:hypothetical protein
VKVLLPAGSYFVTGCLLQSPATLCYLVAVATWEDSETPVGTGTRLPWVALVQTLAVLLMGVAAALGYIGAAPVPECLVVVLVGAWCCWTAERFSVDA